MRDPRSRALVPVPEPSQQSVHCPGSEAAKLPATKIRFPHVPSVAHRREAIADVRHVARRPRRLSNAMAKADDQIAPRQPPRFDSRGHQGQGIAVIAINRGKVGEEACVDRSAFDDLGDTPRTVQKSEKRGPAPTATKQFQALLAAAHAGEPIMHEHYTWVAVCIHALPSQFRRGNPLPRGSEECTRERMWGKDIFSVFLLTPVPLDFRVSHYRWKSCAGAWELPEIEGSPRTF